MSIIDVVSGDFVLSLCVSTEVFLLCRRHGHRDFILMFECLHRAFLFFVIDQRLDSTQQHPPI